MSGLALPARSDAPATPVPDTRHAPAPAPEPVAPASTGPRRSLVIVGVAMSALGALVIAFLAYITLIAGLQQSRSQDVLYAQFRSRLEHGVAPVGAPIAPGQPVAVLTVPSLGLRQVVVEGTTSRVLTRGPGHEGGTPLPGQPGTSVLLGRRATFGAPFAHVDRLHPGDPVYVTTGQGRFTFHIDAIWRSDQSHFAPPTSTSRLTLVTSDPSLTPTRSLVVSAAISGTPAAAGALTTAAAASSPLAADSGAGITAYLWAQGLLLLVAGVVVAWSRLPRAAVWIGALPLGLVVIWNLFENLAALLPNTL